MSADHLDNQSEASRRSGGIPNENEICNAVGKLSVRPQQPKL